MRLDQAARSLFLQEFIANGVRWAHLDIAGRHGICCLQRRHDFIRRKHLDLEFIVGRLRHMFAEGLRRSENSIETLRKT
jgi:hypothetical protein